MMPLIKAVISIRLRAESEDGCAEKCTRTLEIDIPYPLRKFLKPFYSTRRVFGFLLTWPRD